MKYAALLLACVSSCGRAGDAPPPVKRTYDALIQPAVDSFVVDFPARYSPYYPPIVWKDLPGLNAGFCYNAAMPEAYIELDIWYKDKSETLKWIIYHELAHCVLGLGHDTEYPGSLMSPYITYHEGYDWEDQISHAKTLKRVFPK